MGHVQDESEGFVNFRGSMKGIKLTLRSSMMATKTTGRWIIWISSSCTEKDLRIKVAMRIACLVSARDTYDYMPSYLTTFPISTNLVKYCAQQVLPDDLRFHGFVERSSGHNHLHPDTC